jgi:RND family efflux transporter MFP subunit
MKKIGIAVIVSLVVGVAVGYLLFRPAESRDKAMAMDKHTDKSDKKILYYKDPMHPWLTSPKPAKAPDCGMDMVPVYEGENEAMASGSGIKIDPTVVQNIGVKTAEVQKRRLSKVVRTLGMVAIDETKQYVVNTKIMGWVEKLHVNYTGQPVKKGQPLLELYSPDLLSTQEEYLTALRYQKALSGSSIKETLSGTENLVGSTRRRLELWDVTDSQIAELEKTGKPRRALTFHSPADGFVMEKMVVEGASVMAGMDLFKIADLSTIWVMADIYEFELPWIKLGASAEMELPYIPGKIFKGKVTYIYPTLGMESRTVKVRLEFTNPRGEFELRPDMYATVRIQSEMATETIAVPEQSIIRSGERLIAVVAQDGGYFDVREVKGGMTADGYMQILEGLEEGEQLVVSSQFLIDSESNLRTAVAQFGGSHSGHDQSMSPKEETEESPGRHVPEPTKDHSGHEMKEDKPAGKQYTCPMHPEVVSDSPGDCPKCGMHLVEKK